MSILFSALFFAGAILAIVFIVFASVFILVNVIRSGYLFGQRLYWRHLYETNHERAERKVRRTRKKLPETFGLIPIEQDVLDHPDEALAMEKARWRCEDLNE